MLATGFRPWLGHLMVSRQETARPLLTPGEIMQLPPSEEMLSWSRAPRRSRRRRPGISRTRACKERNCSRTARAVQPRPPTLRKRDRVTTGPALQILAAIAGISTGNGRNAAMTAGIPANAGIRREPELPEHEEIVPDERPVAGEFDVLDDEPDVDAAKARTMRQQVTSVARQATMDPADGIEL